MYRYNFYFVTDVWKKESCRYLHKIIMMFKSWINSYAENISKISRFFHLSSTPVPSRCWPLPWASSKDQQWHSELMCATQLPRLHSPQHFCPYNTLSLWHTWCFPLVITSLTLAPTPAIIPRFYLNLAITKHIRQGICEGEY